jgi:hypothetical protein
MLCLQKESSQSTSNRSKIHTALNDLYLVAIEVHLINVEHCFIQFFRFKKQNNNFKILDLPYDINDFGMFLSPVLL